MAPMRAYVDWAFSLTAFDLYLSESDLKLFALSSRAKQNKNYFLFCCSQNGKCLINEITSQGITTLQYIFDILRHNFMHLLQLIVNPIHVRLSCVQILFFYLLNLSVFERR